MELYKVLNKLMKLIQSIKRSFDQNTFRKTQNGTISDILVHFLLVVTRYIAFLNTIYYEIS